MQVQREAKKLTRVGEIHLTKNDGCEFDSYLEGCCKHSPHQYFMACKDSVVLDLSTTLLATLLTTLLTLYFA